MQHFELPAPTLHLFSPTASCSAHTPAAICQGNWCRSRPSGHKHCNMKTLPCQHFSNNRCRLVEPGSRTCQHCIRVAARHDLEATVVQPNTMSTGDFTSEPVGSSRLGMLPASPELLPMVCKLLFHDDMLLLPTGIHRASLLCSGAPERHFVRLALQICS